MGLVGIARTRLYLTLPTSESLALATLEVSVHLDLRQELPCDRYYVEIDIPDVVEILELRTEDLPDSWDAKPPSLETQFIGDDFVRDYEAAVLKGSSSIVPPEYNYLINPNHPQSKKIKVISTEKLTFDSRFKQVDYPTTHSDRLGFKPK